LLCISTINSIKTIIIRSNNDKEFDCDDLYDKFEIEKYLVEVKYCYIWTNFFYLIPCSLIYVGY